MSSTSPESREAFAAGDKARTRAIVHEYVRACGPSGATADQSSLALGLLTNSVAPRLHELERGGLIVKIEARRKTRSGCLAAVYVAVEFASGTNSRMSDPAPTAPGDATLFDLSPDRTYKL